MAKNFRTKLIGQIGEHLVVAELGRRGIVATTFAGNVPDIDIVAYKDAATTFLQVKAISAGTWQFDARSYIEIEQRGDLQRAVGVRSDIDPSLLLVLVRTGSAYGTDAFFILTNADLQQIVLKEYSGHLAKHDGRRPKNPQTTHCAVREQYLALFKDKWDLVEQRLV